MAQRRYASAREAVMVVACLRCGIALTDVVKCDPLRRMQEAQARAIGVHLSECSNSANTEDMVTEWVAADRYFGSGGSRNDGAFRRVLDRLYAAGWQNRGMVSLRGVTS